LKAIILAAGRGSRMEALTDEIPKCMTTLLGKSLLDWQLTALKKANIDDVVIVRGYQKDCIRGKFRTLENPNWENTNMVMTLNCAKDEFNEASIVAYSDILYHPDHIEKLSKAEGDIVICYDTIWRGLWELRFDNPLDDAETFEEINGSLKSIGSKAKHIDEINGQYMGLIKITPKGWNIIENFLNNISEKQLNKLDLTSLLQNLLAKGVSISTLAVEGKWVEADQGRDLMKYENEIKLNEKQATIWSHDWRVK
jgi:choline kinase